MSLSNNFFDETEPKIPKIVKWLFWGFVIVIVLLFCLMGFYFGFSVFTLKHNIKDVLIVFVGLIFGLWGSIFSTYFFEDIKEKRKYKKIEDLKTIANEDLINTAINNLRYYDNRYLENYSIHIELKPTKTTSLIEIEMELSYTRPMRNNQLKIGFTRILNNEQRKESYAKNDNTLLLDYDYANTFDESDFENPALLSGEDYFVTNNIITITMKDNSLGVISKEINLNRFEDTDNNEIIYTGEIKGEYPPNTLINVSYCINFKMEKDSYLGIPFYLPVKGVMFRCNYEKVKNDIYIGTANYLSSYAGPQPFDRGDKNEFKFSQYDGWIIPKSSFVLIWWKKNKN